MIYCFTTNSKFRDYHCGFGKYCAGCQTVSCFITCDYQFILIITSHAQSSCNIPFPKSLSSSMQFNFLLRACICNKDASSNWLGQKLCTLIEKHLQGKCMHCKCQERLKVSLTSHPPPVGCAAQSPTIAALHIQIQLSFLSAPSAFIFSF